MTSEAQLAANRFNALKSTGPQTAAGKAVVALNGIKHGLLSREILLKGEREADLVELGKRLRTQLAPAGELELLLVDRLISTAWRLRRAGALEARLLDTARSDGSVFENVLPWDSDRKKLQLLSRYEVTLERSFFRALHELQRLQAAREGQAVPVPAVVDVSVHEEMALLGENASIDKGAIQDDDAP
jgi:hypothetical protein